MIRAILIAAFRLLPVVLWLCIPAPTRAQDDAPILTARMLLSVDQEIPQGHTFHAAIVADISHAFHVNAHKPTEKWLIPTKLTIQPQKGLDISTMLYPKPVYKALAFSDGQKLALYEKTFIIGVEIKVDKDTTPGAYTLKGALGYQACNDEMCMAPNELSVVIPFTVVNAGRSVKKINQDLFAKDPFVKN